MAINDVAVVILMFTMMVALVFYNDNYTPREGVSRLKVLAF